MMSDAGAIPFFVVGAQRSGTTMLRLMLNAHSRLCVPFESVFIPVFYRELHRYGDLRELNRMEKLLRDIQHNPWVIKGSLVTDTQAILDRNPKTYSELVDIILSELARSEGKVRWGDKTPGYVLDLDVLRALFPNCRVIHLVRDGRDVARSLAGLSWGSRDLVQNAVDWRWKVMMGRKMGNMMGEDYLEVHYEDLVRNPQVNLENICSFIGEAFEPGMLSYADSAEQHMPNHSLKWHRSSVAAPDVGKVEGWRKAMSLSDQIIFEQIAADALDVFGYPCIRHKPTIGSRVRFARYALLGWA